MTAVVQRPEGLPLATACRALGLKRSSVYARRQASRLSVAERAERRSRRACTQPRALAPEERQAVREALYSPEYRDQPPGEVRLARYPNPYPDMTDKVVTLVKPDFVGTDR